MWPFKKSEKPSPRINVNGILVDFKDYAIPTWEFTRDGTSFTVEGTEFDTRLVEHTTTAMQWLAACDKESKAAIAKHLTGWEQEPAAPELLSIEIGKLLSDREIEAVFIGENWGDLGINIVIRDGKFFAADAGD